MSTNDVPGANPDNGDELATGCWAEHEDGSLIFVESTEVNRVVYSIFDMAKDSPIEYRDAMPTASFNTTFSWAPADDRSGNEKWTWHDKTPFPWDRIIEAGIRDGTRPAAAEHTLNAAERIRESRERHRELRESTAAERVAAELRLQGQELDRDGWGHRMETVMSRIEGMFGRIADALNRLPPDRGRRRD